MSHNELAEQCAAYALRIMRLEAALRKILDCVDASPRFTHPAGMPEVQAHRQAAMAEGRAALAGTDPSPTKPPKPARSTPPCA